MSNENPTESIPITQLTDPEPGDVWFSDMTKFWMEARERIEGLAKKYLSPSTPPEPLAAQDWMKDGADFVSQMWVLWARGMTLTAIEAGRLVGASLRARDDEQARDQIYGRALWFQDWAKTVLEGGPFIIEKPDA
jgi:hypothetical protein